MAPSSRSELCFTVYGEPKSGGSKRQIPNPHTGRMMLVEQVKNRSWRQEVAQAGLLARVEAPWGDVIVDFLLEVQFTFYRARPRGHYGSGRNSDLVKPSAPLAPGTRPDVLKYARLAEDALSKVIWRDDAQIVDEHLYKRWGQPRMEVVVRPVEALRGALTLQCPACGSITGHAQSCPTGSEHYLLP